MYTRSFFRGSMVLTALVGLARSDRQDAGFFSAMNIPFKPLRDVMAVVFSVGYLLFPEAAQQKVKSFPQSIEVFRTSWDKAANPILRAITYADRGYLPIRRNIQIPRPIIPSPSSFSGPLPPTIEGRLYFHASKEEFADATELIFCVPGGGFVAMPPICHDDYTSQYARATRKPLVSINYGKAPEYPYPWALEELFDAFRSIVETNGECIGMRGWYGKDANARNVKRKPISITVMGDSAGGNLATGLVMKIIEWQHHPQIRVPVSLVLVYPCLSFEMACWMSEDAMEMLELEEPGNTSLRRVVRSKTELKLSDPLAMYDAPRRVDVMTEKVEESSALWYKSNSLEQEPQGRIHTGLSMTSRMSYFSDRILRPDALRSMALMYLANSPVKPDLQNDFYLSPLMAPDAVLSQFPKTYIICGEKDPLIDDTVIFAARIRKAKKKAHREWEKLREKQSPEFLNLPSQSPVAAFPDHPFAKDPESQITVKILPGMSHGFLQMMTVLPEGKQAVKLIGEWLLEGLSELVDQDEDITHQVLGHMMESVDEAAVLIRRRNSMASRLLG
ncbi:hypothetical protein HDU91_006220 [Kappamyces sp. JEL0680]|nr:hypothetical protein HDU91_006220 [Kappamyces sp. JEL0680]